MTKKKTVGAKRRDGARLAGIVVIALLVIVTGALFSYSSFRNGEVASGILGGIIAIVIVIFAFFVYRRGRESLDKGLPTKDERSRRVLEKASSTAFYISLYLLLAIGFLSEGTISFRDVSQATSVAVGLMAILFAICWAYYNRGEI
jgi:uncharacterized membrane protein